ncbi:MAG: hypothetical protein QOH23_1479 [Gaiellaceae bacterium]|jgi:hypothetical protein|nr:hypothetical protein [Gaiellaceae bacterium]
MSSLPLRQTVRDASGTTRADAVTLNSADPAGGLQQISEEHFRSALAADGEPVTRAYRIAGHSVRLRFAQNVLARRLTRAFAHLEATSDEPNLSVDAWHSSGSAAPRPPLPAIESDESTRGAVAHFDDGRTRALYQPAIKILNVLDVLEDRGWFWAESAADIPEWECATPIRHILHWWLAERGVQQVHAAAVGEPSGGVLVVGKGGSGKSTVSLACASAGMAYAGDDYVAATVTPEPYVHSLYSSAKVEPHHLARFPGLAARNGIVRPDRAEVAPFDSEKTVLYLHESHPGVPVAGFPLRAILLPKITGEPASRISPVSALRALAALAPSTIVQLHTAGQSALEAMKRLVDEVPSFELELGTDVGAVPPLVAGLLHELGSDGTAAR